MDTTYLRRNTWGSSRMGVEQLHDGHADIKNVAPEPLGHGNLDSHSPCMQLLQQKLMRTFEMKHCFTTKSRTSKGPSLHQQKRTRRLPVRLSMRPFSTKNARTDSRTRGNGGAASTCSFERVSKSRVSKGKQETRQTCVIPVSSVQKFERMGRQEGRTKLLNSSTTWRLLVFMVQSESRHFIRQIGNSCLWLDHGLRVLHEERNAHDDFIRIVKTCALEAGSLDIEDEKGIIGLVRMRNKWRALVSIVGDVGGSGGVAHGCGRADYRQAIAFEGTLWHCLKSRRAFSSCSRALFSLHARRPRRRLCPRLRRQLCH